MITAKEIVKMENRQKHIETTDGETEIIKITRSQFRVLLKLYVGSDFKYFTKFDISELNTFFESIAKAYGGKEIKDAIEYFLED
jgi:hypothetical protein